MRRPALARLVVALLVAAGTVACASDPPKQVPVTGTTPPAGTAAATGSTAATTSGTTAGTTPGTTAGTTRGTTAGTTPGSAPGTSAAGVAAGTCPPATVLTLATNAGPRELRATWSSADVTLDASASFVFANFEVPEQDATSGVYQPTLTGDQLVGLAYISSTGGPLTATDYLPVGATPTHANQLNHQSVYSGAGREIVGGFSKPDQKLTVTKIDDQQVCGAIDTDTMSGVFVAKRL